MERTANSPGLLGKAGNFVRNVREQGLRNSINLYALRAHERCRDWRLGISTMGFVQASALGHGRDCIDYEPIHYRFLDIIFRHLQATDADVFLDYGCAKGSALITAATQPFRRVIGVELSSEMCDAAKTNVDRAAKHLKCQNVQILNTNATEFELSPNVFLISLSNPFTGSVFEQVLQRIGESLVRTPRWLRVVYAHPARVPNLINHCPWLTFPEWNSVKAFVYESVRVA